MKFDAKAYRNTVLKKYARGEAHEQLREVLAELQRNPHSEIYTRLDLHTLYAIPNPVKAEDLRVWEQKIVPTLNKAAAFNSAKLLKDLLEILKTQGHDLQDPAFWGLLKAQRNEQMIGRLSDGIRQLKAEYPLGVAPIEELTSRLEAIGIADVTEASIKKLADDENLTIVESLELQPDGIPGVLRTSWNTVKKHTEFRTVLDIVLIHQADTIWDVAVVDQFTMGSEPITPADLEAARKRCEQGRDTDALQDAQKFLGMLREHAPNSETLHSIVLAMLVDVATDQLARGKPYLAVRDYLADSGVSSVDASRLVDTLTRTGSSHSGPGLNQVRDSLAQAHLADAERTLAAIDPGEGDEAKEYAALSAQLQQLKQRKKRLLEDYRSAVSARKFSQAAGLLDEAITIDQGDETLVGLREALPPAAPRTIAARLDQDDVILEWSAVPDDTVRYTVVRTIGSIPVLPSEGTILQEGMRTTRITDIDQLVGQRVHYTVFATRDGKTYSDPVTTEIMVVPPPTDFSFAADTTSVQLTWQTPQHAVGVVITQVTPQGTRTETEVQTGSTLIVEHLQTGATYEFTAQAVYLVDRQRQLSLEVSQTVVPRGQARVVYDLALELDGSEQHTEAIATWAPVDGFHIELWQFPRSAIIEPALELSLDELQQAGGIRTKPLPGGGPGMMRFRPPDSIVKIVPLTVDDHTYLVGHYQIAGNAPQATDIRVEVFGDQLNISWNWPQDYQIMELSWYENARRRTRRVTRARYRDEGGVNISHAPDVTAMKIGTVVHVDDEDSVPLKVPVPLPKLRSVKQADSSMSVKRPARLYFER